MHRTPLLLLALLAAMAGHAQDADQADIPPPPPPLSNMQGGWDNRVANSQAARWKEANQARPDNAGFQLNWLRSEYNARWSNNNGELKPEDVTQLEQIAAQIQEHAAGSFEAHLAEFYVEFPAPGAFADLEAAYRIAPERTELLAPMLSKAMVTGDGEDLTKWARALHHHGGISPALTAAASDVLLSVPSGAVLFTNGDMDTQPTVVRQVLQQERATVLLVDRRLLADAGYRQRTWTAAGGIGPVPGEGPGFARALLRTSKRPVYFALSLHRSWLEAFPGQLHAVGAAFRVGAPDAGDAAALARNWSAMQKPLNAGPLSRNYLLPGAILLERLRRADDEARAALLEHELRRIGEATGAMQDLYTLGILHH